METFTMQPNHGHLAQAEQALVRAATNYVLIYETMNQGEPPNHDVRTLATLALAYLDRMPDASKLQTLSKKQLADTNHDGGTPERHKYLAQRRGVLLRCAESLPDEQPRRYARLTPLERAYVLLNPRGRSIKWLAQVLGRSRQTVVKTRDKWRKLHNIPIHVPHYETDPKTHGATYYVQGEEVRAMQRYQETVNHVRRVHPRMVDPDAVAIMKRLVG
jgi:hypothetical protein